MRGLNQSSFNMTPTEKEYYSTKRWFPAEKVPCAMIDGDYIPTEGLEVLNIEEDLQGRDLITFQWKGQTRQSYVVMKYR